MSSVVVYALPYTPPPPPVVSKWPGLQMTWTGWDGSVWTLTDADGGVYLPRGEVSGLSKPRRERYTSSSPARHGARHRGSRVLPRSVWWPVEVFTDGGSTAWLDLDSAFFRSLHADLPGLWRVTRPDGTWRELELQFDDDDDHGFMPDPSVVGWEVYELNFTALDPLWRGEPIEVGKWNAPAGGGSFFPGPPHRIGKSSTAASRVVTSPSEFEAWPVWRAANGVTSFTASVDGQVIEVPFEVPEGSELLIDTEVPIARLDGVDVTEDLTQIGFAPLQPNRPTQVEVQMLGSGEVTCTFVPQYERAW